jgi:tetratricopeptide (TPR) repeat protein
MLRFASKLLSAVSALLPILAMSLASSDASAQPRDVRERARTSYARGQELFRSGQYEEAERAFRDAYEAVPNPVVLLGIAETEERQGRGTQSVQTLQQYLTTRPDAPDRADVEGRIQRLRNTPARLMITSVPAGASININGQDRPEVTPAEIEVPPERYTVTLRLEGYSDGSDIVQAEFATIHKVELTLETAPAQEDPFGDAGPIDEQPEVPAETADDDGGVPVGVWVFAGVGGAALVAGTVLGFLALSEQASFDDQPTEDTADRGELFALFADVSFGVAAAAGLTAIVLYLTSGDDDESEDAEGSEGEATTEETARLELRPMVGVPSQSGGGSASRWGAELQVVF